MPAWVTKMKKSAISCGTSWSTVMPTTFQPKEAPQDLKAAPTMKPSDRLWKKSPRSTGPARFHCTPLGPSPSWLSLFLKRSWQRWSRTTHRNQPSMMAVPQDQMPVTSSWPELAMCRPSGSSRKMAAAKMTPEEKAETAATAPFRVVVNCGSRATAKKPMASIEGSTVRTEPMMTAAQSSLSSLSAAASSAVQSAVDSSTAGSTLAPLAFLK
mmetsp:Transcript_58902/g.189426  ORF Transcript_58902/g.189426 Transcript_58902/m.189426 type:complete len:212 (+) Transcript_58902:281-916(+)